MSIPKEPRQLMINLMYLVLTALLALNVSAEVMNAFFSLEKGIKDSSAIVDTNNATVLGGIQKQAETYKTEKNDSVLVAAKEVDQITKDFVDYVENIHKQLFEAAGGPSEKDPAIPKRMKDKDITTRLLVMGQNDDPTDLDALGPQLEQEIISVREKLLALADNDAVVSESLPLGIEDWQSKAGKGKKSWADYKFRQMPVAAVFPMLRKMQSDAKASASSVLNYLFKKVKGEEIIFDVFQPVISASKGYVIRGDEYQADVFLSAYSSTAGESTKIFVDGRELDIEEGKAIYTAKPSSIGTKKFKVRIDVTNPLTGQTESYDKEFEYEVGERSVTVSADKMNVFYIGVDNPVSVSAAGISSNELSVSISGGGGSIRKVGSANYVVEVKQPTDDCRINVRGGGLSDSKVFRVKRIPDPVARLGNKEDGSMGNGEFKAQQGVIAWLDNFDFEAKCAIQGFKLVRVPKRQDPIEVLNSGGTYSSDAKRIVDQSRPGDTYYFFDVKARCPGDVAGRKINSMVFTIK